MREIGFDHQHCTFHLLLNINEELREELKQIRKEYESNLKKQNPKLSETQIKKQSKNMDKQLQNMKSTNIISIFLQYYSKKKPTKKQYEYINFLKEKLINLSTNSSKILKEKILPRIQKIHTLP